MCSTTSSLNIVTLNVGGKIFQTSRHTLTAKPDSFLAKLEEHSTGGDIFIDRDPAVFHLILNYLRDDRVVFPADGLTTALLFQEAKYYKLDSLVQMISKSAHNSSGYMDLKEM